MTKPGRASRVVAVLFAPNYGKVTDDDLAPLKAFPNLRSVELPNKQFITDAGLAHLAGHALLEELNLNGTKVTAEGVVRFARGRIGLQRLELTGGWTVLPRRDRRRVVAQRRLRVEEELPDALVLVRRP